MGIGAPELLVLVALPVGFVYFLTVIFRLGVIYGRATARYHEEERWRRKDPDRFLDI